MTAYWFDFEPIPYQLTEAGWDAARSPQPAPLEPRVSATALLRQIALRGGDAACGVREGSAEQKALERAREDGVLTLWMADRLTVRLPGLTVWEIWTDPS